MNWNCTIYFLIFLLLIIILLRYTCKCICSLWNMFWLIFNYWKMKSIQNWVIALSKTWKNGVDFWNMTYKIYLEPFKLLVWCPFDGPDTKTAQITIEYVHRRQVVGRRPVYVFTKFYYRLFIDELIKCYWRPKLKFSPNSNIFSRYKVETFLTK